ncbi:MAG: hypothetical protein JSW23_12065 [Planctomycetota bacterium]|nr:MAG: hypothetical protein JSW23_12065 [Planctomycetota bacterium]
MNEREEKPSNLLDTTDCLEAVGVFRGWKNVLFVVILVCLLVLQACFWLVNLGYVKVEKGKEEVCTTVVEEAEPVVEAWGEDEGEIEKAAKEVAGEANEPTEESASQAEEESPGFSLPAITFRHLAGLIRFFDFLLILAAVLYCLTMLFGLKVSLLGRLGGINHISRAFFLSLLGLVLLLPWQRFFPDVVAGVIYTPWELSTRCAVESRSIFENVWFYLRFTGYWLIAVLFLIFAQIRSIRWAKAILRRLEVI